MVGHGFPASFLCVGRFRLARQVGLDLSQGHVFPWLARGTNNAPRLMDNVIELGSSRSERQKTLSISAFGN
jgi:hypothetical protein